MRALTLSALAVLTIPCASAGADAPATWEMGRHEGVVCTAVMRGAVVDTQLIRSNDNKLVLVAGHPDWDRWGAIKASLAIDDGAPVDLDGSGIGVIILFRIEDPALEVRLRSARSLLWHFAFGDFKASVDGLGEAFDQVKLCPS